MKPLSQEGQIVNATQSLCSPGILADPSAPMPHSLTRQTMRFSHLLFKSLPTLSNLEAEYSQLPYFTLLGAIIKVPMFRLSQIFFLLCIKDQTWSVSSFALLSPSPLFSAPSQSLEAKTGSQHRSNALTFPGALPSFERCQTNTPISLFLFPIFPENSKV